MQKSYTIAAYLNISIAVLFVILISYAFTTAGTINTEDWLFISSFMLVFGLFLWLGFNCLKLKNYNTNQVCISKFRRRLGKVVAVFTAVLAVTLLLISIAGFFYINGENAKEQIPDRAYYYIFLFLLLISSGTAVLNAVFYFKALKINSSLLNDDIDSIGQLS